MQQWCASPIEIVCSLAILKLGADFEVQGPTKIAILVIFSISRWLLWWVPNGYIQGSIDFPRMSKINHKLFIRRQTKASPTNKQNWIKEQMHSNWRSFLEVSIPHSLLLKWLFKQQLSFDWNYGLWCEFSQYSSIKGHGTRDKVDHGENCCSLFSVESDAGSTVEPFFGVPHG